MLRLTNPNVFVTRPTIGSAEFVAALHAVAGPFVPIVNPAFEIVLVPHQMPDFDGAIFTSRAGVSFAPNGDGRKAWCVGEATAKAARDRGYDARSAGGNAMDLTALILRQKPAGRLVHVRGEIVRENITTHLVSAGFECQEAVVYRKETGALNPIHAAMVSGSTEFIFPVFSAETVSIIADWNVNLASAIVVAISDHVADAVRAAGADSVHVSDDPNMSGMVALTARLIA